MLTFTLAAILAGLLMTALIVGQHVRWTWAKRRRERIGSRLRPVIAELDVNGDPSELRGLISGLGRTERIVAAPLVIDLAEHATPAQRDALRRVLDEVGAVALAERGTRRRTPWRRALACETLGRIGTATSAPALIARLDDRRQEVRAAAVRALGELQAADAAPALTAAYLARRCAPTAVLNEALRRLGPAGAEAFEQGTRSDDAGIRISSCYGLAAFGAREPLAQVLRADADAAVCTAAAAALGIVGGSSSPTELVAATRDPDVRVRRAAVRSLGSFDDAAAADAVATLATDEDRETALRAAESLLALSRGEAAGPTAWSIAYARAVAEVAR